MKHCIRCDRDLALEMFGLTAAGNPRSWCRPCHAAYKAAWKKTERGQASERRDRSNNGNARRAKFVERHPERHAAMQRASAKRYYATHKDEITKRRADFHRAHPEVRYAGQLVRSLIFFGLLVRRPCEACGARETQAHHPDHWKPLSIAWLCSACHGHLGRELRDPAGTFVPRAVATAERRGPMPDGKD